MIKAGVPISTYSDSISNLNRIAEGWRMSISGKRDGPAARPLDHQDFLEQRVPGRYPAFCWWEHKYGPDVIGTVVVEGGSCYLELAAEGAGAELLMERAAVLEKVQFQQILPI